MLIVVVFILAIQLYIAIGIFFIEREQKEIFKAVNAYIFQYQTFQAQIVDVVMANKPKPPPVDSKPPAANRNARTEAQKLAASLMRKEWWEKKRAADAQAKAAQEKAKQPQPLSQPEAKL